MIILGVIPARGGSKQIPNKNLRPFGGVPLVARSVEAARQSRHLVGHCVTTDSPAIAAAAEAAGIELIVERPAELATDTAPIVPAVRHAVERYEAETRRSVDAIALLFPTFPLRTAEDLDRAIEAFVAGQPAESLTTVHAVDPRTHYYLCRAGDGRLTPIMGHWPVAPNRQDYEPLYLVDGAIDICTRRQLFTSDLVLEDRPLYHVIPSDRIVDIDDEFDWRMAETLLAMRQREDKEEDSPAS